MKLSRSSRLIAACIAVFSILFMQLAVASYVCPGMPMGNDSNPATMSADMGHPGMTGCEGMDTGRSGLCHAHALGDTARQSLDKSPLPDVQPFMPVGLVLVLHAIDVASGSSVTAPESLLLMCTTAPPIAIRHCCFRI